MVANEPRRLVVIADSLSFSGPEGALPIADERLWPMRLTKLLEAKTGDPWTIDLIAQAGWSVRHAWVAMQSDMHLQQQVVPNCDALVFAVCSIDSATVGLPRGTTSVLPRMRSRRLRRAIRAALFVVHPLLIKLTRERHPHTPRPVYRQAWRETMTMIQSAAPNAALCAWLPALHDAKFYGRSYAHHDATVEDTRQLAGELDVPLFELPTLMRPWVSRLASDGMHWPYGLHDEVATAIGEILLRELGGAT